MKRSVHYSILAACLLGGWGIGGLTAPANVPPAAAEVTAPVATATPTATPTPEATPTPTATYVDIAVGPDTPSPAPVLPQGGVVKGEALPVAPPAPSCAPPTLMAEDGSCVNPDYWDAPPAPAPAEIQEDDPAWNCLVNGNKICGANPLERVEAWGKFTTSDLDAATLAEAFSVTYRGTALPGIDFPPSSYVTIPSHVTPTRVHVFQIETGAL